MSRDARIVWRGGPVGDTDPLALVERSDADVIYVTNPERGVEVAGTGVAAAIESRGRARFRQAERGVSALVDRVHCEAPVPPTLLGGFAFHDAHEPRGWWSGFPALRLVLPSVLVVRRGARVWRLEAIGDDERAAVAPPPVGPCVERDDEWDGRVRRALADIAAGRLSKIVLSRSRSFAHPDVDPIALVRSLAQTRPACTTFLVRRGGTTFLGSTPETLVSVRGKTAQTMALAGSMRVGSGESDASAARRLLECAKNGAEHAYVADAVRGGLAVVGDEVRETVPRHVVRLPEMLHLATGYRARLRPDVSALGAAAALHPTPAVGGVPSAAARERLVRDEPDRGWYAGGVGWIDAAGDGDWAVALRCAVLRDAQVRVFAGAGIVAGSNPATEWDETEAKMAAMARLLSERARAA